jgi:hypothetical protein
VKRLLATVAAVVALAALYLALLRDTTSAGELVTPPPAATIGSGPDAVAVGADGTILPWLSLADGTVLPALPLSSPPDGGRLAGPLLEQARVLGAAPAALQPYVASSYYGESGVDVELRSGIELRFGDASRLAAKWRAAATVLADSSLSALDYVDLHAPGHPSIGGSGHALPPTP